MSRKNNRTKLIPAIILFSLAFVFSRASAQDFPKPVGFVNDFAEVIPKNTEDRISAFCQELKQKTGAEIAVVTMPTIGDEDYTDYASRLFEKWGIGGADKDNGILLLQVVDDRKFRIEVGYGLEGIIPDGLAGEVRDKYVFPSFRQNDFGRGLLLGTQAIASIIAKDAGVELTGAIPVQQARRTRGKGGTTGSAFFKMLVLFIFIALFLGGRGRGGGLLTGLLLGSLLGGGGRGRHYGGFSGGGGFGGGFGGFGGGMSGGGGAGGSY